MKPLEASFHDLEARTPKPYKSLTSTKFRQPTLKLLSQLANKALLPVRGPRRYRGLGVKGSWFLVWGFGGFIWGIKYM